MPGPRGGTDKTCRVVATLGGTGQVVVEDADADFYVAVDRATSRLGRAVARAVERRRENGRSGGQAGEAMNELTRPMRAVRA